MTSMVLGDSMLESVTPSMNALLECANTFLTAMKKKKKLGMSTCVFSKIYLHGDSSFRVDGAQVG